MKKGEEGVAYALGGVRRLAPLVTYLFEVLLQLLLGHLVCHIFLCKNNDRKKCEKYAYRFRAAPTPLNISSSAVAIKPLYVSP